MKNVSCKVGMVTLATVLSLSSASAWAQSSSSASSPEESANEGTEIQEIIVTANKREQNFNDVGMSINAFSGEQLATKQVADPTDLIRLVPGFTYTRSQFDFPTYTLRGVGFYESSLAASPTVSVYVDEVPLPYPAMTRGTVLDLERLEVLKGPQGTLFGQNSTGGAINYIAAKPTDNVQAGLNWGYGRFNTFEGEGFVSGPISDTLSARLAVKTTQSGNWQYSKSRPGQGLGSRNFTTGRLLLDFKPSETVRFSLNVNGWMDKSDTQAGQVAEVTPVSPALPIDPRVTASVITDFNSRIAEWSPNLDLRRNNKFWQASLRGEIDLSEDVTLTSITSYQHYDQYAFQDADGTTARNLHLIPRGEIKSFSQELRLGGQALDSKLSWLIGGNFQSDKIRDNQQVFLGESTGAFVGPFQFDTFFNEADSRIKNYAAFANGELQLSDSLSIQAGLRYTKTKNRYLSCTVDSGAGDLSGIFQFIQGFLLAVPVTAAAGQCVTLLPNNVTGRVQDDLNQDNLSWKAGVNFKPGGGEALLYANVSQGFKAGSFPTLSASNSGQLLPVTQEKLLAYEAGFKAPVGGRSAQINGAVFYYDYTNKQLRGRVQDLIFGQLEKLVNIPKSRIWGAELQAMWRPVEGLTLTGNGSYVNSRILKNSDGTDFANFPQRVGPAIPFTGNAFPYTPDWTLSGDIDYKFPVGDGLEAFLGGALTYQSRAKAGLEDSDPSRAQNVSATAGAAYNDQTLILPAYALLDLRVGIGAKDGVWKATVWAKNVTNKYYIVNVLKTQDTLVRYAGQPVTYGVSLSARF
jgi:iron complex outermembrane recepter protein